MDLDWSDLAAAFALYLVIEGLMPFLNPRAMKQVLGLFQQLPDVQMRVAGAVSIAAGLAMLWLVRH